MLALGKGESVFERIQEHFCLSLSANIDCFSHQRRNATRSYLSVQALSKILFFDIDVKLNCCQRVDTTYFSWSASLVALNNDLLIILLARCVLPEVDAAWSDCDTHKMCKVKFLSGPTQNDSVYCFVHSEARIYALMVEFWSSYYVCSSRLHCYKYVNPWSKNIYGPKNDLVTYCLVTVCGRCCSLVAVATKQS